MLFGLRQALPWIPNWPWIHNPPASAFSVLELQVMHYAQLGEGIFKIWKIYQHTENYLKYDSTIKKKNTYMSTSQIKKKDVVIVLGSQHVSLSFTFSQG